MNEFIKYVGLDVHKETIAVSIAPNNGGDVRYWGEIANTIEAMDKLIRQLKKGDSRLSFCYEASPCGYGLHRRLTDLGWLYGMVSKTRQQSHETWQKGL